MKKPDIKLQILFFVLSGLAILSASLGGYLYYSVLSENSKYNAHKEAAQRLKDLETSIDSDLAWSLLSVKSLAGLTELNTLC